MEKNTQQNSEVAEQKSLENSLKQHGINVILNPISAAFQAAMGATILVIRHTGPYHTDLSLTEKPCKFLHAAHESCHNIIANLVWTADNISLNPACDVVGGALLVMATLGIAATRESKQQAQTVRKQLTALNFQ